MNDQYAKNANETQASRVSSFWQEGFTLIHLHEFHMSHTEYGKGQSELRETQQAWVSMPCHRIIKEDPGSGLEGGCSSLIEAVQQTWPPKAAHVKMGTLTSQACKYINTQGTRDPQRGHLHNRWALLLSSLTQWEGSKSGPSARIATLRGLPLCCQHPQHLRQNASFI